MSTRELTSDELLAGLIDKVRPTVGGMTKVWMAYVTQNMPTVDDLPDLQAALVKRASEAQRLVLQHLSAAGVKLLPAEEMARRLAISSRQGVNKRKGRDLLGVSFEGRKGDFYPDFQLDGGLVRPWVRTLVERIPDCWAALAFLTAKRESLDGESYLKGLIEGEPKAVERMLAHLDDYLS
jgi:hypothetical protein